MLEMKTIKIPQLYGDQIDSLVAEYCMGWQGHRVGFIGRKNGEHPETQEQVLIMEWAHKNGVNTVGDWWIELDDNFAIKKEKWQPSTDIKDAYKALRSCMRKVPQHDMHIEHLEGCGWNVSTCFDEEELIVKGGKKKKWYNQHYCDTLPQAMCLTCLLWCKPEDVGYLFPEGVLILDEEDEV